MWGSMSTLFTEGEHVPRGVAAAKGARPNQISTYHSPSSPHEFGIEPSSPVSPLCSVQASPANNSSPTFLNNYRPVVLSAPSDLTNRISASEEVIELSPKNQLRPDHL